MKDRLCIWTAGLAMTLLMVGCATTEKTRSAKPSGFLGDYSKLRQGGDDEAQLVFINPQADWSKYTKVLMDPVRVYANRDSKLAKHSPSELKILVDSFDASIRTAIAGDYAFVTSPGPEVLRIRIAITEAKGSVVLLDTMSNVLPPMVVVTSLKKAATGTHLAVGKTGVEAEILDAQTGKQLAAMVDERAGGKTFKGKFGKWNDTKAAFDHWAGRLKARLATLRG